MLTISRSVYGWAWDDVASVFIASVGLSLCIHSMILLIILPFWHFSKRNFFFIVDFRTLMSSVYGDNLKV